MTGAMVEREPRRLVVALTPLGRSLLLLGSTTLALGVVLAVLGAGQSDLGGRALIFVALLGLAAAGSSWLIARSGLAAVSARVVDPLCGDDGDEILLPLQLAHGGARFVLRDVLILAGHARSGLARPIGFLASLSPGESLTQPCVWRLARRGRQRELRLSLSSSFPLGLVEARLELVLACDVLALPRRGRLRALPRPPRAGHGSQEARRRGSHGSLELRFLRRWREGEDLRLVHWKVSARTGERVLRELEGEEQSVLRLFLVAQTASAPRAVNSAAPWHEGFERAVRLVATLAEAARVQHPAVRVAVLGRARREGPALVHGANLPELLEFLAEVEPCEASAIDLGACARAARAAGERPIFVHAATGLALPGAPQAQDIDVEDPDALVDFIDVARRGATLQTPALGAPA